MKLDSGIHSSVNVSRVCISSVETDRAHPSGRLASFYSANGYKVFVLFQSARSLISLLSDSFRLVKILRDGNARTVHVNVNGSVAQCICVIISKFHGAKVWVWVMDSYPGALRYTTRWWPLFYPIFYLSAAICKTFSDRLIAIDESFPDHSPTVRGHAAPRWTYCPLPVFVEGGGDSGSFNRVIGRKTNKIGIIGNIERDWFSLHFPSVYGKIQNAGWHLIIATSKWPTGQVATNSESLTVICPWAGIETSAVFDELEFLLVPLSRCRLIYSSPSKIIEAYSRGVQPVILTPDDAWEACRRRNVYRKCITFDEFISGSKGFDGVDLIEYSRQWVRAFDLGNL